MRLFDPADDEEAPEMDGTGLEEALSGADGFRIDVVDRNVPADVRRWTSSAT